MLTSPPMWRTHYSMAHEDPESGVDWFAWPNAPEAGRELFVNATPNRDEEDHLTLGGWRLVDVRTLPSATEADRAHAILAFLEGVRVGSVQAAPTQLRFIELEARICGLLKGASPPKSKAKEKVGLEQILAARKEYHV